MRYIRFDPVSGIAGNMILGALTDAGVSTDDLREDLSALDLTGWSMTEERVSRGGIDCNLIQVVRDEVEQPARHLSQIERIIGEAHTLDEWVRTGSIEVFRRLAVAEARAHGIDPQDVHFHEVGAVDALIDVVGTFCALYRLGVRGFLSGPVGIGSGTVQCAHGVLPVPAPATAELLREVPVAELPEAGPVELTTPTGAAILVSLVEDWGGRLPTGRLVASGMGAGSRDNPGFPNLLRVLIVHEEDGVSSSGTESDRTTELRTVVDDLDSRTWPDLSRRLLDAGAIDCYTLAGTGRKGRPCLEIVVLAEPANTGGVSRVLFEESTTIGLRVRETARAVLPRESVEVATSLGTVRVKLAFLDGKVISAEPELEDCSRLAAEAGASLRALLREARQIAAVYIGSERTDPGGEIG